MLDVVIADDQELVRSGFRLILERQEGIQVTGEAANGREAVELAHALAPRVLLMDIRMPELDGIEATRRIARSGLATRVLVLTTFDLDEYVYEALRAGASGFLLKDVRAEDLVGGVRAVARGDALLAPTLTARLIGRYLRQPAGSPSGERLAGLTPRELEVLRLLARGLTNTEIASTLFLGETTVKTHVGHILRKLGARDRVQAVVAAYESGLVVPGAAEPQ